MAEYKSNYTGSQIDTAIGKVEDKLESANIKTIGGQSLIGASSENVTTLTGMTLSETVLAGASLTGELAFADASSTSSTITGAYRIETEELTVNKRLNVSSINPTNIYTKSIVLANDIDEGNGIEFSYRTAKWTRTVDENDNIDRMDFVTDGNVTALGDIVAGGTLTTGDITIVADSPYRGIRIKKTASGDDVAGWTYKSTSPNMDLWTDGNIIANKDIRARENVVAGYEKNENIKITNQAITHTRQKGTTSTYVTDQFVFPQAGDDTLNTTIVTDDTIDDVLQNKELRNIVLAGATLTDELTFDNSDNQKRIITNAYAIESSTLHATSGITSDGAVNSRKSITKNDDIELTNANDGIHLKRYNSQHHGYEDIAYWKCTVSNDSVDKVNFYTCGNIVADDDVESGNGIVRMSSTGKGVHLQKQSGNLWSDDSTWTYNATSGKTDFVTTGDASIGGSTILANGGRFVGEYDFVNTTTSERKGWYTTIKRSEIHSPQFLVRIPIADNTGESGALSETSIASLSYVQDPWNGSASTWQRFASNLELYHYPYDIDNDKVLAKKKKSAELITSWKTGTSNGEYYGNLGLYYSKDDYYTSDPSATSRKLVELSAKEGLKLSRVSGDSTTDTASIDLNGDANLNSVHATGDVVAYSGLPTAVSLFNLRPTDINIPSTPTSNYVPIALTGLYAIEYAYTSPATQVTTYCTFMLSISDLTHSAKSSEISSCHAAYSPNNGITVVDSSSQNQLPYKVVLVSRY